MEQRLEGPAGPVKEHGMDHSNAKDPPAGGKISAPTPRAPALAQPLVPTPRDAAPAAGTPPTRTRQAESPAGVVARPNVARPPAPRLLDKDDAAPPHEHLEWFAADGEPSTDARPALERSAPPEPESAQSAARSAPNEGERTGERRAAAVLDPVEPHAPRTLVAEGTELNGSLASTCTIEVKGRVEGDITAPSLVVAASGAVHGKVKVGELRSEGVIAGELDADVARLSGAVKGDTVLRTKSLEMKLAPIGKRIQLTFGECAADVGNVALRGQGQEVPK